MIMCKKIKCPTQPAKLVQMKTVFTTPDTDYNKYVMAITFGAVKIYKPRFNVYHIDHMQIELFIFYPITPN